MKHVRSVFCALAAACAVLASSGGAQATEVEPLLVELTYGSPAEMSGAPRVRSTAQSDAAIELSVVERVFDEDGVMREVPADDDFVIFPPMAVLQAGATQVFRFQYVGEPVVQSRSYYIVVSQVPVSLDQETSRIDVLVRFSASVNIAPPDARADYAVRSATYGRDDAGAFLMLVVENEGLRHGYLSDEAFTVTTPEGDRSALSGAEFRARVGDTLVPGAGVRGFRLALPEDAPEGDWSVSIRD